MKKLLYLPAIFLTIIATACNMDGDNVWEDYRDWRETNEQWILDQASRTNDDGTPYYTKLVPTWDKDSYILIHYFNDRNETKDNLTPLFTSTVDVKYIGRLYNDEPFDSSYAYTQWGDSILRTTQANLIEGWAIALSDMHVGDSCEILVPYQQAYGSSESGIIKPYSALKFNLKLVDIPYYETKNPE